MPKFEEGVLGLIPKDEWLNTGFHVETPNDPVAGLFPDEKTDNLVARWQTIASEYQIPEMAHFHAFDTEAEKAVRVPIDIHNIEKGLIKRKINESERMRELLHSGVYQEDALYNYVLQDGIMLQRQVVARTRVAENELLSTGKITIKENGLDLTVDYGVPAANTTLTLTVNDTSDVPGQIEAIIDKATNVGVTITGMITSKQVLTKLRTNKSIQTAINGNLAQGTLVRRAALEAFLSDEFGINQIILNDQIYRDAVKVGKNGRPTGVTKRYFPQNKITFFGIANDMNRLGVGLWGDPPEITGTQGLTNAAAGSESPYIYTSQWMEQDPSELWTKASALFMPVLFDPNSLWIATVADK